MIRHSLATVEDVIRSVIKQINDCDDASQIRFHWDFEPDDGSKAGVSTDGDSNDLLAELSKLNKSMLLRINEIYAYRDESSLVKALIIESTATRTGHYSDAVGGAYSYTENVFRCSRCGNEIGLHSTTCPHCFAKLSLSKSLAEKRKEEKEIKKAFKQAKEAIQEAINKVPVLAEAHVGTTIKEKLYELATECDEHADIAIKYLYK